MWEAVDCCAVGGFEEAPGTVGAEGFADQAENYCPGAAVALLTAPAPPGLAPPEAGAVAPPGGPTEGTELGDTVGEVVGLTAPCRVPPVAPALPEAGALGDTVGVGVVDGDVL